MAITLGDAITYFRGDTSDVDKALADTEGNVKGFGDRLAAGVGGALKVGAVAAAGGVLAIGGALAGTISQANEWAGRMDSLGDVLGTSAKDSATLAVAINGVGGDVEAVTGQMAKLASGLVNAKGELGPTGLVLDQMGIAFKDANGNMLSSVDIIQNVANKVATMPDGLEKSTLMMDLFGKSGKDMTDTLGALTSEGLDKAGKKASEFGLVLSDEAVAASVETGKKMKDLEMAFQGVAVNIGGQLLPILLPLVSKFVEVASVVLPQVTAAIKPLVEGFINFAQAVLPQLQEAFSQVEAWLRENWPGIQTIVSDVLNAIASLINDPIKPILSVLITVLGEVVAFVVEHWPEIKAAFDRVFKGISDLWNQVLRPILEAIITLIGLVIEAVLRDIPQMQRTFETVFAAIELVWNTVLKPVFDGLSLAVNAIVLLVTVEFPKIAATVTRVMTDVQKVIGRIIEEVKGVWEGGWEGIKKTIDDIFGNIFKFFEGLPKRFVQFAVDTLQGFIDGLRSMKDKIVSAFIESLPPALRTVAETLGIKSPSRVMYDFGVQTMQGFVDGLNSMANAPAIALGNIASGLTMPALGVAGLGAGGVVGAATAAGAGRVVNVTINNANTLASNIDVDVLAWRIARRIEEY